MRLHVQAAVVKPDVATPHEWSARHKRSMLYGAELKIAIPRLTVS
jgi:hypothetical protein